MNIDDDAENIYTYGEKDIQVEFKESNEQLDDLQKTTEYYLVYHVI